jgi:hypothetical protein
MISEMFISTYQVHPNQYHGKLFGQKNPSIEAWHMWEKFWHKMAND